MRGTMLFLSLFVSSFYQQTEVWALAKRTEVYAHRGGRAIYPENTLEAYLYSTKLGVDFIDMDVGVTQDGIVVVTHNSVLDPDMVQTLQGHFVSYTESERKNYLVKNFTYAQLKQFKVGKLNQDRPYARLFPMQKQLDNVYMPTLEEVIDTINQLSQNQVKFQIEMKTNPLYPEDTVSPDVFAQKIYGILKKKNIVESAEVQSFDWRCLYALQNLDYRVRTAYLTSRERAQEFTSKDKLVRTRWTGGKDIVNYNDCTPCMIAALGGKIWGPEDSEVTKESIDMAHKFGLKVAVWSSPERAGTTFDEKRNKDLIAWGVDGIISDDPAQLKKLLEK